MKKYLLTALIPFTVATASELDELKKQLQEQQQIIQQLQEKVKKLQENQEVLEQTREKLKNVDGRDPIEKILSNPFSQAKFVPDISLLFDFSYVSRNLTDDAYKSVMIPGFNHGLFHSHEGHEGEGPYNAERGFNLNYTHLSIAQTVDPYFDLVGIFHLREDAFEIEEAYIKTRQLPYNLGLKLGKFYSSFGRLNQQHHHYWDFVDAPLVYYAIFGPHNLLEKGAQLTWLAPTPFYLQLGLEVLQGDNENNFNRNGFTVNTKKDGTGDNIKISDTKKPNLYTFFIKPSFDIGNVSILTGLSYAQGGTRIDHLADEDPHALSGTTKIYGADLTVRYNIDSYRYITWQSEYLYRKFDGKVYKYNKKGDLITPSRESKQSGFYSQVVYKFDQRWRVGARYDLINKNDVFVNGVNRNLPNNLYRYSFMIDFLPSEFSRIRLQYNYDKSLFTEDLNRKTNQEIILQFNIAIGAHGAHGF